MSKGINKAIILGRLGQDPEVRATGQGTTVVNLSVATDYKPKNGETVTEWHRIVMFGKVADIAGQYLKKGSQAYFEGRIQTRKWQDQQGNDRYSTEVVAHDLQLLGDGGTNQTPSGGQPAPQPADYAAGKAGESAPANEFDDIPF